MKRGHCKDTSQDCELEQVTKKVHQTIFFLMIIFQNNCDLNNSIVIYENGYFVYKPNKSGV
jgi:hypothetical protein